MALMRTSNRESMQSTIHDEDDFGLDPTEVLLPEKGQRLRQHRPLLRSYLYTVGKCVLLCSLALAGFAIGYHWPRKLDQMCFNHTSMYCKLVVAAAVIQILPLGEGTDHCSSDFRRH